MVAGTADIATATCIAAATGTEIDLQSFCDLGRPRLGRPFSFDPSQIRVPWQLAAAQANPQGRVALPDEFH
jgi:hypothetical protein